jgi:hypothetical protein
VADCCERGRLINIHVVRYEVLKAVKMIMMMIMFEVAVPCILVGR